MAAEELKIPVFTVLKNGAILKNIFIVNTPPPLDGEQDAEAEEELLVVGRHHDCDIVLTHPSISRFHLHIYSDPSSQKLSVMDLSSVHGTWVSGKKIKPREKVELMEGDTLRVGGSSRVYRLHWIPLSQAYDLEQSFVSASDVTLAEEKEEEVPEAGGREAVEAYLLEYSNEPSHKREEEHSPSSGGEVVEEAEDGGLSLGTELEEVEKFTDPLSKMEKENIMVASGEDEGSLDAGCEKLGKFKDTFSEEDRTEFYQNILSEDQEIYSLDLIFGEMESLAFTESSKLPANCETSTRLTMFENKNSSVIKEDEALFSPSEIDLNKTHYPMRLSLPIQNHCGTDNMKFADDKGGEQGSDDEFLVGSLISETSEMANCQRSSGEGTEGSENLDPFYAFCLPDSALSSLHVITAENGSLHKSVDGNLVMPQLLCSKPELPSENYATQSCVGIDQTEPKDMFGSDLVKPATEPLNSRLSEHNILSEVTCRYLNEEIQPARSPLGRERQSEGENLESPPIKSSTKPNPRNIWSRRGKPATALQLRTGSIRGKSRSAAFKSENGKNPKVNVEDKVVTRNLFAVSDGEEEICTPDKENMTPNTRKLKFMKEIGKVGVLHSRPLKGSSSMDSSGPKICPSEGVFQFSDQENRAPVKENFTPDALQSKSATAKNVFTSPISYPDDDSFHSSDKENQTPKFQRGHRIKLSSRRRSRLVKEISGAKGKERVPFESLHINSEMESPSAGADGLTSSSSIEFTDKTGNTKNNYGERKKTWIMVADTSSFLDKELRKSLQLLQGLRGTQLFIPRIVLRELDSLKRQHSWFRRNTEVSSVLEWIEETMLNSNWWIHIQSSAEEGWAIAPTPRASPYSLNEESDDFPMYTTSSARFSFTRDPSVEIVSPATEDRILEYALLVRKRNYTGQLVLLSNDTSLKIKAMAEGLLCETTAEFRESLVNPFSERFMWSGSSARGQTWSLSDDIVLKENCPRQPFKKPSRGNEAKGLKLILRHNSQYAQIKPLN